MWASRGIGVGVIWVNNILNTARLITDSISKPWVFFSSFFPHSYLLTILWSGTEQRQQFHRYSLWEGAFIWKKLNCFCKCISTGNVVTIGNSLEIADHNSLVNITFERSVLMWVAHPNHLGQVFKWPFHHATADSLSWSNVFQDWYIEWALIKCIVCRFPPECS